MKNRAKIYAISLGAVIVLLFAFTVFSMVITLLKGDLSMMGAIFPCIYLGMHLVIITFCFMMNIAGYNKGSQFVSQVTLNKNDTLNKEGLIKPAIFSFIGLVGVIVFGLSCFNIIPLGNVFSLGLLLDFVNIFLGLFVGGLVFITYPLVMQKKQ